MQTITKTYIVYEFDELSEQARQHALDELIDINVDFDWWEAIYEDAAAIDLTITDFNLQQGECNGQLTECFGDVIDVILKSHGEASETYQLAKAYLPKWNEESQDDEAAHEETEQEFLTELLKIYLSYLTIEYDYQTSDEAIIEAIKTNDYQFTEAGELADV